MKDLIQIDLNQTVSKTELKEKKQNNVQWVLFSFVIISFLGLIGWLTMLIIKADSIITDQNQLKKIIRVETNLLTKNDTSFNVSGISVDDVNNLKNFQENRIFWGPKLMALVEHVPDDMVITKMQQMTTTNSRSFKMDIYLRQDSTWVSNKTTNKAQYIKNSAFVRANILDSLLKQSPFIDNFKLDESGEPLFSPVKYESDIKKGNLVEKIVFEGELSQTFKKQKRVVKRD